MIFACGVRLIRLRSPGVSGCASPSARAAASMASGVIRRALALTQEEFAVRYHIPLGTLRDWEQGRAEPDQATQAYLKVIAREPERVERLLNSRPHGVPRESHSSQRTR